MEPTARTILSTAAHRECVDMASESTDNLT
jgi:hypothetical protein